MKCYRTYNLIRKIIFCSVFWGGGIGFCLQAQGVVPVQTVRTTEITQNLENQENQENSKQSKRNEIFQTASGIYSIQDLQNIALQKNPGIRMMNGQIQANKGEQIQQGLYPNPEIGLEAEEIGEEGSAGKHGIVFSQEIITANKRQWAQNTVGFQILETKTEKDILSQKIINDVAVLSYEYLGAQKMKEIRQNLLELAEKVENETQQLYQSGELANMDYLDAKVQTNEARLALQTAENTLEKNRRKLLAMIGVPELQLSEISDSLDFVSQKSELSESELLDELLKNSPEVAKIQNRIKTLQSRYQEFCADNRSNITASAGVFYDYASETTLGQVGIAVPVRIFNQNQGNLLKVQAEISSANAEMERLRLQLRTRFADELQIWQNSQQEIQFYQTSILADAKKSFELSLQAFQKGEIAYLEVAHSQRIYFEFLAKYVDSLQYFASATVRLEGMLLQGGLD